MRAKTGTQETNHSKSVAFMTGETTESNHFVCSVVLDHAIANPPFQLVAGSRRLNLEPAGECDFRKRSTARGV
jgi:hypothetical protein